MIKQCAKEVVVQRVQSGLRCYVTVWHDQAFSLKKGIIISNISPKVEGNI